MHLAGVSIVHWALLLIVTLVFPSHANAFVLPFGTSDLRATAPTVVVGDLGGVAVSIPKHFAQFVEYDDDPAWTARTKKLSVTRNYQSKLRSFGFEIRFPDMAGMTADTQEEYKTHNIYTTPWMRVGITSNSHYGSTGDTANNAHVAAIPTKAGNPYRYEKLPQPVYGLTCYTPVGVDKSLRKRSNGPPWEDRDIYFLRNAEGTVTTYVECGNGEHRATRCALRFNLLPAMRANVEVNFRKELLPHWKEIQGGVSKIIVGFKVNNQK